MSNIPISNQLIQNICRIQCNVITSPLDVDYPS